MEKGLINSIKNLFEDPFPGQPGIKPFEKRPDHSGRHFMWLPKVRTWIECTKYSKPIHFEITS